MPGVFGTDYTYPTHTEIDYYAAKGMSVVRLPFLWERVQRSENAPLDAVELGRLDDVVSYATGKGLKIEIEPHNYGYGFGALIGSTQTPNAAFADLWGKLAFHYQSNSDVMFGLMNEPHDQSASEWLGSANAAIAAIRGAGAVSQEILVPGSYWDGAWTWTSTDNDTVIGTGVQDSVHNFAFEVHQYLDADGSGTHAGAVSATIGVERLTAITQWAEATGNHLFLGEVGVTTDQTSLTAFDGMLTYMQQHTGAWQGVTYWAGGPWWRNYMFSIEPQNGIDKPQMGILLQHLDEPVNHAPVVTVPNSTVHATAGQTLQLSNLVSAADVDNDTLAYILYDATSGGGHFVVNGLEQPANQIFGVTAAQMAQTTFVPAPGVSDDLLVGASDGHAFSGWSNLHVDGPVNHAPVVDGAELDRTRHGRPDPTAFQSGQRHGPGQRHSGLHTLRRHFGRRPFRRQWRGRRRQIRSSLSRRRSWRKRRSYQARGIRTTSWLVQSTGLRSADGRTCTSMGRSTMRRW